MAGQGMSTPHSISSMPMAALPSRAHHALQLTAMTVMTRGKDKTRQCHPHAPHCAPRCLAAAPTTNGHDSDNTWQGQICRRHLHVPHCAPCSCTHHAPCSCMHHIAVHLCAGLFSAYMLSFCFFSTNSSFFIKVTMPLGHNGNVATRM